MGEIPFFLGQCQMLETTSLCEECIDSLKQMIVIQIRSWNKMQGLTRRIEMQCSIIFLVLSHLVGTSRNNCFGWIWTVWPWNTNNPFSLPISIQVIKALEWCTELRIVFTIICRCAIMSCPDVASNASLLFVTPVRFSEVLEIGLFDAPHSQS